LSTTQNTQLLFPDDGLPSTSAESWVKHKVETIAQYLTSFAGQLAGKVDDIIFVDLNAGNGMYSIGSRKDLFPSTALTSLTLDVPITRYIFCENDPDRLATLKIRVNKYFRTRNVILLRGKPADLVDRLDMYTPQSKGNYRSAVICLCDAFALDMPFHVMQKLSEKGFSFLIPFTFALNDRVNYEHYLVENRERLKRFLGTDSLDRLEKNVDSNATFYKRLVMIYQNNLLGMGFNGSTSAHKIDSGLMELPVYCMGLYSQSVSTRDIQETVDATHHVQFDLFDS
jgi:three-Cys-motif partner protein